MHVRKFDELLAGGEIPGADGAIIVSRQDVAKLWQVVHASDGRSMCGNCCTPGVLARHFRHGQFVPRACDKRLCRFVPQYAVDDRFPLRRAVRNDSHQRVQANLRQRREKGGAA